MANLRRCLRDPIPEVYEAARCLEEAVAAHLSGNADLAALMFRQADTKTVWNWLESVWGKASDYNRPVPVAGLPPQLLKAERYRPRDPTAATKRMVHARDGYHCRYCGIPVIRDVVRVAARLLYPAAIPWNGTNATQHAAFQCLWVQYDHVVPHSRGGSSELDNLVLSCAACNYGKGEYTLEEMRLSDPRLREPAPTAWDGLERLLAKRSPRQAPPGRLTSPSVACRPGDRQA